MALRKSLEERQVSKLEKAAAKELEHREEARGAEVQTLSYYPRTRG
jgi:hypothetical protein